MLPRPGLSWSLLLDWRHVPLPTPQDGPIKWCSGSPHWAAGRGCGRRDDESGAVWGFHLTGPFPEPSRRGMVRAKRRQRKREGSPPLTSSMVHLATVEAEMPATPGRSLQCCSQHTDSDRSGWADRADMKRDCCVTSVVSAARQRQRPAGQGRGPTCLPPKPAYPQATWETGWQRAPDCGPFQTALQSQGGEADPATPHPALVPHVTDHVGRPHPPPRL